MVSVATPPASVPEPSAVLPERKVTVPVGVAFAAATTAVALRMARPVRAAPVVEPAAPQALAATAIDLGGRSDLPDRLGTIGQNLLIMANKFGMVAAGTYPPELLVPGVAHYYTNTTPGSPGSSS